MISPLLRNNVNKVTNITAKLHYSYKWLIIKYMMAKSIR
jgi:hypothetical protein